MHAKTIMLVEVTFALSLLATNAPAAGETLKIQEVGTREVERNEVWSRYSWKVVVANYKNVRRRCALELSWLDKDGYEVTGALYFLRRYPGEIGHGSREMKVDGIDRHLSWHDQDSPGGCAREE